MMSWLPVLVSWFIFWGILSVFYWDSAWVSFLVWGTFLLLSFYLIELSDCWFRSAFAFFLFVGTEILVFVTLIISVIWHSGPDTVKLSYSDGYPTIATVLLVSSSLTVSAFHHNLGSPRGYSWLKGTIALGVFFVIVQYLEIQEAYLNFVDSSYASAALSLVGLHFAHVAAGLVALWHVHNCPRRFSSDYYPTLIVWYWHFVDIVWVFVYFTVYIF